MDLTAAAVATLISSLVASVVALTINNSNKARSLNDQLDSIIKIAIQYPYLESLEFTQTWTEQTDKSKEDYLRYENYCTLVFNYMERVAKHYHFNKAKIQADINIKDWIRLHKGCWLHPSQPFENTDGYCEKFRKLIEDYLK